MSPQPFTWTDRDTAARDMIQLVYHGPHAVRTPALIILSSIRSLVVVEELKAIGLSPDWGYWERIYAIRALQYIPKDIAFPELLDLAESNFATWKRLAEQNRLEFSYTLQNFQYHGVDASDDVNLLDEISHFVDVQQANRPQFWALLKQADPVVARDYINDMLIYHMTSEMRSFLVNHLIAILDSQPQLLNLPSISHLYDDTNSETRAWLNKHFDQIVALSLTVEAKDVSQLPYDWPQLRDALAAKNPLLAAAVIAWDSEVEKSRKEFREEPLPYEESPIWKRLEGLYQRAANGDREAGQRLMEITRQNQKLTVSVRAAAVHFLGKLQEFKGITKYLCDLLQYNNDRWGKYNLHSPIRHEAGAALKNTAAPEVWEAMLNAFFLRPDNVLEDFMLDWLAYLTNVLSGDSSEYKGRPDHRRRWFSELADMDDNLVELRLA